MATYALIVTLVHHGFDNISPSDAIKVFYDEYLEAIGQDLATAPECPIIVKEASKHHGGEEDEFELIIETDLPLLGGGEDLIETYGLELAPAE